MNGSKKPSVIWYGNGRLTESQVADDPRGVWDDGVEGDASSVKVVQLSWLL